MNSVIEMVSFKLAAGVTEQDFMAAVARSQKPIAQLAGFQYRSLSYNAEQQRWTDIYYWQSMTAAKAADEAFMSSVDCQALIALTDKDSVVMQHQEVHFSSCDSAE
ncbi:hypothetical protein K6Y31_16805 [Motilimonas cestriensis]|uniref:ABM domain-containing protein n=1 Tax=Motilimonas cestriensis TaxID=2742685 RepID=A0ABS8WD24_9GAMM|nr:hypothetical protein [Motilimonas cestriensis]MCE2596458.1 hypothetical protein [Motilimonas cestriensis]